MLRPSLRLVRMCSWPTSSKHWRRCAQAPPAAPSQPPRPRSRIQVTCGRGPQDAPDAIAHSLYPGPTLAAAAWCWPPGLLVRRHTPCPLHGPRRPRPRPCRPRPRLPQQPHHGLHPPPHAAVHHGLRGRAKRAARVNIVGNNLQQSVRAEQLSPPLAPLLVAAPWWP